MRKLSKKAKAEKYDALREERDLLELAVWFLGRGDSPDDVELAAGTEPGEWTSVQLYGATRADGGFILERSHTPGQKDFIAVKRLDEAYEAAQRTAHFGESYTRHRDALGALARTRTRLLQEKE